MAYLASMLEIGLIAYGVGAIALSVAYYDLFLVLILLTSILRGCAQREINALEGTGNGRYPVTGYAAASLEAPLQSARHREEIDALEKRSDD